MTRYVALLRGINVGGKNIIKMTELKACLERRGFERVRTYIQSGNVLFSSGRARPAELKRELEEALGSAFGYQGVAVLRSRGQMGAIVERAPAGFGCEPKRFRYDVLFLDGPLTSRVAIQSVPQRAGVDAVIEGPGVLYYSRLISQVSKSQLSRVVALPIYRSMTLRNWNTTTKLASLLEPEDV